MRLRSYFFVAGCWNGDKKGARTLQSESPPCIIERLAGAQLYRTYGKGVRIVQQEQTLTKDGLPGT